MKQTKRIFATVATLLLFTAPAWGDLQSNWDPTTSGPFYTGTAETVPPGSFFVETYWFDQYQSALGTRTETFPFRFDIGLLDGIDVSGLIPYEYTLQESKIGWVHGEGIGDAQFWVKKELVKASDRWPALSTELILKLPSGNASNFKSDLFGADQTGFGTTDVGVSLLARKRFEPFEIYGQVTYTVASEAAVSPGYVTSNGVALTQGGEIAPGDTITYSAAFEHVLNEANSLGYLVEIYGMYSRGLNMFRGPTDNKWSFLDWAPEIEVNSSKNVSWGTGFTMPIYESNYPSAVTAMLTVTYSYSGPEGHR